MQKRTGRRGNLTWTVTRGGRGLPQWLGFVFIGAGLLFALALARYQVRLAFFGMSAIGEVVAFQPLHRRYAPRVRFTTPDGRQAEFLGTSLRGAPLAIGDRVPILYIEGEPLFGEIATFRRFWLGVIVVSLLSIGLLVGGVRILRTNRKRTS